MSGRRNIAALLVAATLCGLGSGCQSSRRFFSMDSNSGAPWMGFDLSLPKRDTRRKTLETISDRQPAESAVKLADLPAAPVEEDRPGPLARWLRQEAPQEQSLPLPPDALTIDDEEIVALEGPREEFRHRPR